MSGRLLPHPTGGQVRVGPWRGADGVARMVTAQRRDLGPDELRAGLEDLWLAGFHLALTPALTPREQIPFLVAGFTLHEELHLLRRDLHRPVRARRVDPAVRIRRGRRGERAAALAVDGRSFTGTWRLDAAGLEDALRATPSARLAVALLDGAVVGYAVTGRATGRGFLQRLAVEPAHRGQGIGSALVVDGTSWLRRRWAHEVLVNTQVTNAAALALYLDLGFHLESEGLAVLVATPDGDHPGPEGAEPRP